MAGALVAKGNVTLSVNSQETEARLVFTADLEGGDWDAVAINKLAAEKQLGAFHDPKILEGFLIKASKAKPKETLELVYCEGVEPEAPVAEKVTWEIMPVPGDMAPYQADTLGKAGPPEIIRVKVEKIKHEKTVTKAGVLPFMSAKEEVAVTWEKKETREKVDVNPKILEIKYADRGRKIGSVSSVIVGKPGKNIFGKPIPPPQMEGDGSFLFGKGIIKEKNDLKAEVSGFIRVGENWADIVPLSKHFWQINTGIDGLTLFLRFEPGDPRFTIPKGEEILAGAVANGAAESVLVSAAEIDEAIDEAVKSKEPLEAFSLFSVQKAEARVDINEDKTKATLYLRKGVGGALPLEMKTISQVIKNSGVHGFSTELIKTAIQTFMQGKDLELKDYVLADGIPSTRGKDREVQIQVALLSSEEQKTVLERIIEWDKRNTLLKERIDPEKATNFAFVEKGMLVAKVSAGSDGEAGKDIYGNVIPGLPGNDPDIKLFRGLEIRGSDITASKNGLLLLEVSEKSFHGEVLFYQDAKIGVHVSEDVMEVTGDFFREEGSGIPLTVDNVKKVLDSLGITKGIDWDEVEKACVHARTNGSVLGCVLAKGEVPVAKGGSAYKWLVPLGIPELASGEKSETVNSEETAVSADDFLPSEAELSDDINTSDPKSQHVHEKNVQIKAGNTIVELSEPFADGRPGYDVKGTELTIEKGIVLVVEHDRSIRELPMGKGKRLVAARSGELSYDGKKLKISSVKSIQGNAGPDTGHIKFSGEIQISGNVLPGCKVIGGSHVIVDGLAEAAFIVAGGKAAVAKGFKGDGKGVFRARAGITSAFVERASVMAIGDIQLNRG
ncbi:MAG: FapA family protein, partial [Treponema sp.]|nr:FapA family protein [Treponema sp.]